MDVAFHGLDPVLYVWGGRKGRFTVKIKGEMCFLDFSCCCLEASDELNNKADGKFTVTVSR